MKRLCSALMFAGLFSPALPVLAESTDELAARLDAMSAEIKELKAELARESAAGERRCRSAGLAGNHCGTGFGIDRFRPGGRRCASGGAHRLSGVGRCAAPELRVGWSSLG